MNSESKTVFTQTVRFQDIEIVDGQFLVNGEAVTIREVNRRDFYPDTSRFVPLSAMQEDVEMMKRHNVNAVRRGIIRTIHGSTNSAMSTGCTSSMRRTSSAT